MPLNKKTKPNQSSLLNLLFTMEGSINKYI